MENVSTDLLSITTFSHAHYEEYFAQATITNLNQLSALFREIASVLMETGSNAINFRIFTDEATAGDIKNQFQDFIARLTCPITWIAQETTDQSFSMSVQFHAVSTLKVTPIMVQDEKLGCHYADEHGEYVMLGLLPDDVTASNFDQTYQMFCKMQKTLACRDFDFTNTVRTWLFADDILAWYERLNKARDQFFNEHDIFNRLVPASTGVGVANPAGAALTTELIAMKPAGEGVKIEAVNSPLQCPALDYKSSFSRAVVIRTPDHERLYISGTASIDIHGKTAHLDDTPKQIDLTMDVAEAILKEVEMDWSHVVRGIAYVKDPADFGLFDTYGRNKGLALPHVKVHADVCRHDLLFELEVEAFKKV